MQRVVMSSSLEPQSYREGGMENENFRHNIPEDKERIHRFTTLGYNVGRIENWVYHLEHARGENSWLTNPHIAKQLCCGSSYNP